MMKSTRIFETTRNIIKLNDDFMDITGERCIECTYDV